MNAHDLLNEIRETNLTYVLLAQQMLREDKEAAMFRLGVSNEVAELLLRLTPPQVIKLAGSNMLLCRFRFEDHTILGMLSGATKEKAMVPSHMAILMAGQPVALAA